MLQGYQTFINPGFTYIPYAVLNSHVEAFMKGSFGALKLDVFIFLF